MVFKVFGTLFFVLYALQALSVFSNNLFIGIAALVAGVALAAGA